MSFVHLKDAVESSRRSRHLVASCGFAFKLATHTHTWQKNNASGNANAKPLKCVTKENCHKEKCWPQHTRSHTHRNKHGSVCTPLFDLQNGGNKRRLAARERFKKRQLPFIKASCKTILYECVCVRECTEVCVCVCAHLFVAYCFPKLSPPPFHPPRLLPAYFMAHTL